MTGGRNLSGTVFTLCWYEDQQPKSQPDNIDLVGLTIKRPKPVSFEQPIQSKSTPSKACCSTHCPVSWTVVLLRVHCFSLLLHSFSRFGFGEGIHLFLHSRYLLSERYTSCTPWPISSASDQTLDCLAYEGLVQTQVFISSFKMKDMLSSIKKLSKGNFFYEF